MTTFVCQDCARPYPKEFSFRCPHCDGIFDVSGEIDFRPSEIDFSLPGIWKYRHSFGLPDSAPVVYLGEGDTPLAKSSLQERDVYFKLEYLNPTGSFKDRLTAPEISHLVAMGITDAVEDSSGNAGSSFAAYAARAGIRSKVFVPSYASGPKRDQIGVYGAELVSVPGPRSAASEAVMQAVADGAVYASHAYLPFGTPGLATIAYELVEQLGRSPGAVVAPVGHGSLLQGIILGFEALLSNGKIESMPHFVGVQAAACAPVWAVVQRPPSDVAEGVTLAEGVRVLNPVRGPALVALAGKYPVEFVTVEEPEILVGRDELAKLGFYVEPTSAIVWGAMLQKLPHIPDPVVSILTGFGLKSSLKLA